MKRRHGLLLLISACIPGCGQMYQGYMKRGVSLLGACCGLFALASLLGLGELGAFIPLIWLYAFFDTYNIRAQTDQQAEENPDRYLFGLSELDEERLRELFRSRHSLIGWCLVALGIYALIQNGLGGLYRWIPDWLYSFICYSLPRLAATVLIIALGVWFIRGPKDSAREEYQPFVPPLRREDSPEGEDGHGAE